MEEKFNIVIIDDDVNDSWVTDMQLAYKNAIVKCFTSPQEALEYVDANLTFKTIIFLDCYFEGKQLGASSLLDIRGKSSLISVVMMSAQDLKLMNEADLIDLINAKDLYYVKKPEIEDEYKSVISQIQESWKNSFDCNLEKWLLNNGSDDKVVYYSNGNGYTVKDVLDAIRQQKEEGRIIQSAMNLYAIDALSKSKI